MFLNKINLENLSNTLLYRLSKKSTLFKIFLLIFILLFLGGIGIVLCIRPLRKKCTIAKAKLIKLHEIKNVCMNSYDQCTDFSSKIEHLNAKVNKKLNSISYSSAYVSLAKVIECINTNGVKLIDYSPLKVKKARVPSAHKKSKFQTSDAEVTPESSFFKKVTFELTLESSYLKMLNFFKCLSSIKYCLQCTQLSLDKNEQGLIKCRLVLDILELSK